MHARAARRHRAPIAFLIVALALTAAASAWLGWGAYRACRSAKATGAWALRVEELRGSIIHLDEVLTMSARMAAATGDPAWEQRYRAFEPKLDAVIKEAIRLAPETHSTPAAADTDAANALLVEMENRAFSLVRQGALNNASAILFSPAYEMQKAAYAKGMATLEGALVNATVARLDAEWRRALMGLATAGLTLPLLVGAWIVVVRATRAWQAALVAARGEAEAKLQRLALVAEQAGEGIAVADLDGRLLFVNAAWARMHGYETGEELVGRHLSVFHSEEQMRDDVLPTVERVLRDGQSTSELRHVRKDGTPFVVSMIVTLLRDAEGEPIGIAALAADITDQRRTERALADSEAKFRTLFERTSDAVMLLDEQAFFDCNDATLTVFGCSSREEFLQRHPADLSPPTQPGGQDSLSAANGRIATALATGANRFEWMHRRVDGADFPAEVLLSAIELGGRRVLQAVVRDITDRKRAEEQVAKTLAELELFNRLAVGRELRMIELKREVNDMARAAGLLWPYDLSSLEPSAEAAEARLHPQTGERAPRNAPSVAGGSPGTVPATPRDAGGDSLPAAAFAQEVHS